MILFINVAENRYVRMSGLRYLAGFRPGDIIRCEADGLPFSGKKLTINGFSKEAIAGKRHEFVIWATPFGKKWAVPLYEKGGLILLERPGLPFKVGDKVVCTGHEPLGTGRIIVIDPTETTLNFLVRFSGYKGGFDGYLPKMKNWFPRRLIGKKVIGRRWLSADRIQKSVH